MLVYTVLLLVSCLSLLLYDIKGWKFAKAMPYIIMALVSGFRYYVGKDYETYMYFYDAIVSNKKVKAEIGYVSLVKLIHLIGGTQQLVFLVMAVLTSFFFYLFISSSSIDYSISTLLYLCLGPFYFSSFNTMREALAIAIVLCSLKYIRCWWKYCIGIIIASCFHASAIVFLLLLFAKYVGEKYLIYYLVSSVGLTIIIYSGVIQYLVYNYFPRYIRTITVYSQRMDFSYLIYLFIGLSIFYLIGIHEFDIQKEIVVLLLMACSLITVGLLTSEFTMLLTRLASYGTPSIIVILPKLGEIVKQKQVYRYLIAGASVSYYIYIVNFAVDLLPYSYNFNLLN